MNQEAMELIVAEKLDPVEIFDKGGMDKILSGIKERVDSVVADANTDKGRQEIKSTAYKISRSKTLLDDLGKERVSDWKKKAKSIDAVRKHARDFLDNLRDEFRKPLTEFEESEQRRKEEDERKEREQTQKRIDKLSEYDVVMPIFDVAAMSDAEFKAVLDKAKSDAEEAKAVKEAEEKKRKEEEQRLASERAELEKIRKEQETKEAAIRAEQEKIEAEKRKIEEGKRLEIAKKEAAEQARKEAEERQKLEEQERIEREKAIAEEKARQEALKPDKEKMTAFAQFLQEGIKWPELTDKSCKAIITQVHKDIFDVGEFILDEIDKI